MKKTIIIAAILAMAVLMTESCTGNIFDKVKLDVPVAVNSHTSTPAAELLIGNATENIVPAYDGTLLDIRKSPDKAEADTAPGGGKVSMEQQIRIHPELLPADDRGINPGVLITADAPIGGLTLSGTLTTDDGLSSTFLSEVPAGKTTLFLGGGPGLPAPDADIRIDIPEKIQKSLKGGFRLHNLAFIPATETPAETRTIKPMSETTLHYSIEAAYCSPLAYAEGTILHVDRRFDDMKLNLADYLPEETGKRFAVCGTIRNTMPFRITGTVDSEEGITGELENAVEPGAQDNPSETECRILVERNSASLSSVNSAVLHLTLTAAKDAVLKEGQGLDVDIDQVIISIL